MYQTKQHFAICSFNYHLFGLLDTRLLDEDDGSDLGLGKRQAKIHELVIRTIQRYSEPQAECYALAVALKNLDVYKVSLRHVRSKSPKVHFFHQEGKQKAILQHTIA